MTEQTTYDVAIAGGGLAGLSLAIQLADKGYKVILFEKEQYPFHRVCGEYISLESWDFLAGLGVDLTSMKLPAISKIVVSGRNGELLSEKLPLGGFGISRYTLDHHLAQIAFKKGVKLLENTRVNEVDFSDNEFLFKTTSGDYRSNTGAGCFGKRSNLDIKWKRDFTSAHKNRLNNYVGIKYHVRASLPMDTIALHWFDKGYCGIVKVEADQYCLCYLTTAENLQQCEGSIPEMEEKILCLNPVLKTIWPQLQKIGESPVTIAQISFDKKTQVENHMLMIGDAAGMITPLCGNGMSMALHGSKIAFKVIDDYLQQRIDRKEMERSYERIWNQHFSKRLRTGRWIQTLLSKRGVDILFIKAGKLFPSLLRTLIRQTHGKPF